MTAINALENELWESHATEKGHFHNVSLAFRWVALSLTPQLWSHQEVLLSPPLKYHSAPIP